MRITSEGVMYAGIGVFLVGAALMLGGTAASFAARYGSSLSLAQASLAHKISIALLGSGGFCLFAGFGAFVGGASRDIAKTKARREPAQGKTPRPIAPPHSNRAFRVRPDGVATRAYKY